MARVGYIEARNERDKAHRFYLGAVSEYESAKAEGLPDIVLADRAAAVNRWKTAYETAEADFNARFHVKAAKTREYFDYAIQIGLLSIPAPLGERINAERAKGRKLAEIVRTALTEYFDRLA